jgi:hypothetical protein
MMHGGLTLLNIFALTGSFRLEISGDGLEAEFDAQMRFDPIGQVDASGMLSITSNGVVGALQLGGRFSLGPVQIFGAMQLEINTTNYDRTIQRVQYDFASKSVSSGKVAVVLPAAVAEAIRRRNYGGAGL